MKTQPVKKVSKAITPEGLRPWQPAFWDAMIGKCPGKDDAGAPGSRLTPEALWDMACLYFQGENEDTMIKKDFIRSGEAAGKIISDAEAAWEQLQPAYEELNPMVAHTLCREAEARGWQPTLRRDEQGLWRMIRLKKPSKHQLKKLKTSSTMFSRMKSSMSSLIK